MNLIDYKIVATGLHTIVLRETRKDYPDIHPHWVERIEPKTYYFVCMRNDGLCVITRENPNDFHHIYYFGWFKTDDFGYIWECES